MVITFVEKVEEMEEIRQSVAQMDSFSFWENGEEDIYQDFLTAKDA